MLCWRICLFWCCIQTFKCIWGAHTWSEVSQPTQALFRSLFSFRSENNVSCNSEEKAPKGFPRKITLYLNTCKKTGIQQSAWNSQTKQFKKQTVRVNEQSRWNTSYLDLYQLTTVQIASMRTSSSEYLFQFLKACRQYVTEKKNTLNTPPSPPNLTFRKWITQWQHTVEKHSNVALSPLTALILVLCFRELYWYIHF